MRALSARSMHAGNPNDDGNRIAAALQRSGVKVIKLNRGDPAAYFKTPRYITDAYVDALMAGKTSYSEPQGVEELREAVAKRYLKRYGVRFTADDVLITQGVSEAVLFLNAALVNDGERAVIFKPYYPLYRNGLNLYGGRALFGTYDEGAGWDVDPDRLRGMLDRAGRGRIKYMLIANPSNPTGTVLPKGTLGELVDIANEHSLLLISDEIYDELVFNNARFTSVSQLAKGMPHIILNGASKDFDATGFRLGFVAMPGRDRLSVELMGKLADFATMRLSTNTPAQYAFAEGIRNAREHERSLRMMLKSIERRVNFATKLINESGYMNAVKPNGAFYIFPRLDMGRLKVKDDGEFAMKLLEEEHIQLTRGSGFGAPGHIRIVALAPEEILSTAIERIDKFCRRHSR